MSGLPFEQTRGPTVTDHALRRQAHFVYAERGPSADPEAPVGSRTVLDFGDNHLAYAITWFALAATVAAMAVTLVRPERHARVTSV